MTETLNLPAAPPGTGAEGAEGAINIGEDVIAKLAAAAAGDLPDVGGPARGLGHLTGADVLGAKAGLAHRPKASAHLDGDQVHIDLTVSTRWPVSLPQVTAALREHVRTRIQTMTGLPVATVNIEVADLITADRAAARVH